VGFVPAVLDATGKVACAKGADVKGPVESVLENHPMGKGGGVRR